MEPGGRVAARRGLAAPAFLMGAFGLLVGAVAIGHGMTVASLALLLVAAAPVAVRLLRWQALAASTMLVILFVPIRRYLLPGSLPFNLEPYRVLVALVLLAWITSLLIDGRVRVHASGFEAPIVLLVIATLGSELANPARVSDLGSYVFKSLSFFVSYVLFFYFLVSVIRTRGKLDALIRLVTVSGAVLGALAVLERRTGYNVFNHLQTVFPILKYQGAVENFRDGGIRAYGSGQHPIAFGVVLVMIIPLALYLMKLEPEHRRRWGLCALLLALGTLSTGSRTGFMALAVALLVFLWLRPVEVKRYWPALLPALIAIHFAVPGAIGTLRASFFPKGGLIAEQSHVVVGNQALSNNRLADIGPSMTEFMSHNPLFGEGYGTRVTGFNEKFQNAAILDDQWLKTLLETGLVGMFAWLWLLGRSIRRLGRASREDDSPGGWLAVALAASLGGAGVAMATYDTFSFTQSTFLIFIFLAFASLRLTLPRDREPPASEAAA
jgi:hypothetical protein